MRCFYDGIGDDLYSATLKAIPTNELLVPMSIYTDPAYTNVCGTDTPCLSNRYHALKSFTYPDKWIIARSCNPEDYGYIDCYDYINQEFGAVLTREEIANAVDNMINNYCQ